MFIVVESDGCTFSPVSLQDEQSLKLYELSLEFFGGVALHKGHDDATRVEGFEHVDKVGASAVGDVTKEGIDEMHGV